MHFLILIEGSDRTGKSSLARVLLAHLPGWAYRHHGVPPTDPYNYFSWFANDARSRTIVDRLYLSERCYGIVYRNTSGISSHDTRLLELALLAQKTTLIHLDDTLENVQSRWGDEPFNIDGVGQLLEEFRSAFKDSVLNKHSFDVRTLVDLDALKNRGPHSAATNTLLELIEEIEVDAMDSDNMFSPSVGWGSTGGFMVIGDEPNYEPNKKLLRPPGTFCSGPSSELLWNTIDEGHIDWTKGYYTNQNAFEDSDYLETYIRGYVRPTTIVTLGKKAHDKCRLSHFQLPHPGYILRYSRDNIDKWKGEFLQALGGFEKR